MINVLVTGSNGQLGSCIKELDKKNENLNIIYTDYLELDICNLNQVQDFFKAHSPIHYCVNCAAYTAVDNAENDKEKAYQINALAPKNLALVCKEYNTVLIHVSTDFVFNGAKDKPYTENDLPNPLSVYGESKLQGENNIQKFWSKYIIIRTSWLYSSFGNNFLKTMVKLSKDRDSLSIVNDQIGTPTFAGDLAEVLLNIIKVKSQNYGVYHYSNEGAVSWYDFAKEIFKELGLDIKTIPIKTEQYPTPARRPNYSVLDKTKIKEIFKIEVGFWKDSLKKCLEKIN